ncbi:hypothetical protein BD414DRAFT_540361 [Trametes punicea]|nr:hypothetical protein BD414DRAFT_540361 [Trametes punicea]
MSNAGSDPETFALAADAPDSEICELGYVYPSGWVIPLGPVLLDDRYDQPGGIHYVPPSAISKRYYALSNPYEYSVAQPLGTQTASHAGPATLPITAPTAALQSRPEATTMGHNSIPRTIGSTAQSSTPSGSSTCQNAVLPKQRRNRDDPGGEAGPLAQPTTQHEDQPAARDHWMNVLQGDFSQRGVPDLETGAIGQIYATSSGSNSNNSNITMHSELSMQPSTSPTATDAGFGVNVSAIYSPTTGRKLPLGAGPGKAWVEIVPGTTGAKRPYTGKRATPVACAFCRKRKIACGGPQEGDEEGRCG